MDINLLKLKLGLSRSPTIGDKHLLDTDKKEQSEQFIVKKICPLPKRYKKPDLIMNPHAVPSRMTIAQVIECSGENRGKYRFIWDATAFTKFNVKKSGDILESLGYERNCDEILYNGRTGEQLKVKIFVGPTYYQRLKHMVDDKIHSRGTWT